MAQGIGKLRRAGGAERADRLDRGLDGLLSTYSDRILPLDAQAARLAGEISDAAIAQGRHPGFADVAIAALAQSAPHPLPGLNVRARGRQLPVISVPVRAVEKTTPTG
jgi:predicted nucleic acid-binding protein